MNLNQKKNVNMILLSNNVLMDVKIILIIFKYIIKVTQNSQNLTEKTLKTFTINKRLGFEVDSLIQRKWIINTTGKKFQATVYSKHVLFPIKKKKKNIDMKLRTFR